MASSGDVFKFPEKELSWHAFMGGSVKLAGNLLQFLVCSGICGVDDVWSQDVGLPPLKYSVSAHVNYLQ